MKPTSKELLEKVSQNCFQQITLYSFNKNVLKVSDKYREGRLASLKYISELTFYYMQEEKRIQVQLREQILKQMRDHSCLGDSDYKDGLYDALNATLDEIKSLRETS